MSDWKNNKLVGVAVGAVLVIALLFIVRGWMSLGGEKAKLTEAEKKGIPPAEEIARKIRK